MVSINLKCLWAILSSRKSFTSGQVDLFFGQMLKEIRPFLPVSLLRYFSSLFMAYTVSPVLCTIDFINSEVHVRASAQSFTLICQLFHSPDALLHALLWWQIEQCSTGTSPPCTGRERLTAQNGMRKFAGRFVPILLKGWSMCISSSPSYYRYVKDNSTMTLDKGGCWLTCQFRHPDWKVL